MKNKQILTIIIYVLAFATAHAQSNADVFRPLFNGKDLAGWDGNPELWTVENGCITGKTTGPEQLKYNQFIIWRGGLVKNFELHAKVKQAGNNSGIQYRSKELPVFGKWSVGGYQCDIHPAAPNNAMVYEERARGIITQNGQSVVIDPHGEKWLVAVREPVKVDVAEWHDYTIIAQGNHLIHKLDGKLTIDLVDYNEKARALGGILAFQIHAGPAMSVQIKDVMLKELPEGGVIPFEQSAIPSDAKPLGKKVSAGGEPVSPWTDVQFPAYIKRLNQFGERPDWSHDGKKILFVGRSFGDVYELEVATGTIKPVTHHYYHGGYLRALYLSNSDILLLGPKSFSPDNWRDARFKNMELWVLDKKMDRPPVPLGEFIWEGPAVSRTRLRIAWAKYPDAQGLRQLMVGDIDYSSGKPELKNQRVVLDNAHGELQGTVLEPQNFRPGNENELTVQVYGFKRPEIKGAEVYLLNLNTSALTNCSQSPLTYDEVEGIYPDGQFTLVECSRHNRAVSTARNIDLYKLKLDGSRTYERVTYFNDQGKFKASNPVVSDDGKFIAFMVARCGEVAGIGHGIYLLDIEQCEKAKR